MSIFGHCVIIHTTMKKKNLHFTLILMICLVTGYFLVQFSRKSKIETRKISISEIPNLPTKSQPEPIKETREESLIAPIITEKKIQQEVPFTVQAPFGNWKDLNFQNGCEEASIVMAMGWVKNEKTISTESSKKRILELVDFENKTFGYSTDTDANDIEKIFKQHFKHEKVLVKKNISIEDIKSEIQKGNVVIVPAFGRALKNPNFTSPGPIAHMLVVVGHDPEKKQFITNDPGTKKGAGYVYDENLLFDAIWEYPSGKDLPPAPTSSKLSKTMISISR